MSSFDLFSEGNVLAIRGNDTTLPGSVANRLGGLADSRLFGFPRGYSVFCPHAIVFAWPCTLEILLLPECAAEPMVTTEPCFKSTYARLPSRFTFSVFRQKADGWLTASLLVIVVMLYGTMYTCPCPVEPVPGGPFLRMVPL